ncbi:MAG: hypothetical protein ACRDFS_02840 [Chloroflexota bacterium]
MPRRALPILVLMGTVLLAGCGSRKEPFSLACREHVRGDRVLARVSIENRTSKPADAILYGPALSQLRHNSPVLIPQQVTIVTPRGKQGYIGFKVGSVSPKRPARIEMRFVPPPKPEPMVVSSSATISTSKWSAKNYPHCSIHK